MKLIALLLFPLFSFCQIKVDQKISMLEGKVELMVPKALSKITEEVWKLKYGNAKQPMLALSDNDGEANLIGQMTNQEWDEKNIAAYKDFRIENLKKTRTDLTFLENGVKDVHGKKVGYFQFMSQAADAKIFNYYFFTTVDGKVFVFTFNCPEKLKASWGEAADEILASLVIQ